MFKKSSVLCNAYFHLGYFLRLFLSFPFLSLPYVRLRSVLLHTYVHAYIVRYDDGSLDRERERERERGKENSIEIRFVRYLHILKLGVRKNEEERHSHERYSSG